VSAEVDKLGLHVLWFLTPAVLPTSLPYVATVWDLAHRVEPQFPEVRTTGWSWDAREAHYRRWLPRAAYVITGAAAGRDDIARCYGVSSSRVRILPLVAPTRRYTPTSSTKEGAEPYLFYPAQFWPHKNHVGLLLALKELRDRHGLPLNLVLTGSDKGNLAHVRATTAALGLEPYVRFAGFVAEEELSSLYSNAVALVFPSFFGPDNLPPLEAMALGCPVVASDVPGVGDQLGDAAVLVNPRNVQEIAGGIARICREPGLREALIRRGRERAVQWQPRDYAAGLLRILDEFETERRCWSYTAEYTHL
jgi:glycosyltransferase involved in cell wall biosynthesis